MRSSASPPEVANRATLNQRVQAGRKGRRLSGVQPTVIILYLLPLLTSHYCFVYAPSTLAPQRPVSPQKPD
ncbi:hypothetical protein GCM10027346_17390 [Hymenobacter seoulensis]